MAKSPGAPPNANSGETKAQILERAEREKVKFLRLQFTDILGTIKNVEIPDRQFEDALNGEIMFDGERINGIDPDKIVRRGIFQVMEGRRIIADMTSLENLRLGAFTRSDNEVGADIDMVFNYFPRLKERTGLAGYLSGGEQQMLAIGRALMARPKMILMDEPSMGLSPLLVKEVFAIIKKINRDLGVTILLVEQNARAALSVASHGYIMEQGKVVLDGSADELRDNVDVKEFYLGGAGDQRKSFKNLKSFKRRKRWL